MLKHIWLVTTLVACTTAPGEESDQEHDAFLEDGKADDTLGISAAEGRAVLRLVNNASFETLDLDVALDVRAARNIVAARPIETLAQLDAIAYVGPVALEKMVAHVNAQTLADVLPAGELDLAVTVPTTRCSFNAIAQGGPYNCSSTTPSSLTLAMTLSADRVRIDPPGVASTRDVALVDGAFSLSSYQEGITSDGRRIWFDRVTITGHVDPLGELVVDSLYSLGGSGNSIYGYSGTIVEQAGEAYAPL
jgi:hypothetical protein